MTPRKGLILAGRSGAQRYPVISEQLGINISQACNNHLREVVYRAQSRKWREEHADFIAAYNATLEAEGLPLDGYRSF